MISKFSLRNVFDNPHRKMGRTGNGLGRLLTARQQTEQQLTSLREVHSDLLDRLNATKSGDVNPPQFGCIRLNIAQVNSDIEDTALQLASLNRRVDEERGSKSKSRA
jgi:hypothetical protein